MAMFFSISVLEDELSRVREEREHQMRQLRGKMEQNAQSLQHQYSIQEAKVHSLLKNINVPSLSFFIAG